MLQDPLSLIAVFFSFIYISYSANPPDPSETPHYCKKYRHKFTRIKEIKCFSGERSDILVRFALPIWVERSGGRLAIILNHH